MELPKSTPELAIWLGMQFPVLGSAVLLAYWAVKLTERLHENRIQDARKSNAELLAEKDQRIRDRDDRIKQLESEVADLRAKMSRPKKPPEEPKPRSGGMP